MDERCRQLVQQVSVVHHNQHLLTIGPLDQSCRQS